MKIRIPSQQGSVLMVTLVTCTLVGFALISYLSMVSQENRNIGRSSMWNAAIPVAEAGIEEALAHLDANKTALTCCGWTASGTNVSRKSNLGDGYYVVNISTNPIKPVIVSEGFVPNPLGTNFLSRKVRVLCTHIRGGGGITLRQEMSLNGNDVVVDSYDSRDPLFSTDGLYDAAKRKDNVRIVSGLGIQDALYIGNADVWGSASTTPGGSVTIGPNGSLGDMAWHNAAKTGIQPGAFTTDAVVPPLDPPVPPLGGLPALPLACKYNGVNYSYWLTSGTYIFATKILSGVLVDGTNVTIIAMDEIKLGGSGPTASLLTVKPGASLKLYAYKTITFGGSALQNETKFAGNAQIFGMPGCNQINFNGSVALIAQIYAPNAKISAGGGGTPIDFCGSIVADSLKLNGRVGFHWDEATGGSLQGTHAITQWNEL